MQDKIKKLKDITDSTAITTKSVSDLLQCPKCYQLFTGKHSCNTVWSGCSICHINLDKRHKLRELYGHKYVSLGTRKHYRIINSLICYNCACSISRMLKHDKS